MYFFTVNASVREKLKSQHEATVETVATFA
jgi:hypothetical protein